MTIKHYLDGLIAGVREVRNSGSPVSFRSAIDFTGDVAVAVVGDAIEVDVQAADNASAVAGQSYTELRLASGTAGKVRIAKGRSSPNDGGEGSFVWSDTAATDDDGTIINAGGYGTSAAGWRRVYSGPLNVKWFGALGDGATNDYTAFTRCFAALGHSVLREIDIPVGNYRINTTLDFPNQCVIRGGGTRGAAGVSGGARLTWGGSAGAHAFRCRTNIVDTHIEHLILDGNDTAGVVFQFEYLTGDCSFEYMTITGAEPQDPPGTETGGILINFDETVPLEIDNVVFRRCILQQSFLTSDHCKYLIHNWNPQAFNITFEHCILRGAYVNADFSQGSCNFYNCQMFGFDFANVRGNTYAAPFTMQDCYNEQDTGYFYYNYASNAIPSPGSVRIIDCQCSSQTDIRVEGTQDLVIDNLLTAGNIQVHTPWPNCNRRVFAKNVAFALAGTGFTGAGATTHVDEYGTSYTNGAGGAGESVERVTRVQEIVDNYASLSDAHACLDAGRYRLSTVSAHRYFALPGAGVVQTGSGPTVGHTGSSTTLHDKIRIIITTGGALGVGAFKWSRDDGATFVETGVTLASTHTLTGTGFVAIFASGTYVLNEEYAWNAAVVVQGSHVMISNGGANPVTADVHTIGAGEWVELTRDSGQWNAVQRGARAAATVPSLGAGVVHSSSAGALTSSAIVNADVDAAAAIAGTKISPAFGSQNISCTGDVTATGGAVSCTSLAASSYASIGTTRAAANAVYLDTATATNQGAKLVLHVDANAAGFLVNYDESTGKNSKAGGSGYIRIDHTASSTGGDIVFYTGPNVSEGTVITVTERLRIKVGGDVVAPGSISVAGATVTGLSTAGLVTNTSGGVLGTRALPQAYHVEQSADITRNADTFADMGSLTQTFTPQANSKMLVTFTATIQNDTADSWARFDMLVDGSSVKQENFRAPVVGTSCVTYTFLTSALSAASHTIKMQWASAANTLQILPASVPNYYMAALDLLEILA